MKKIVLAFVVLFLFSFGYAQEVSLTWGESEKISSKSAAPELIGKQQGKVYVLKSENAKDLGDYYINSYQEEDLSKVDQFMFEKLLPQDVQKFQIEKILLLSDRIVIISVNKNKELVASVLDLNGKLLKGKLTIDRVGEKDKEFEGFEVVVSKDLSHLLSYRKTKGKVKKSTAYSFVMYDNELKRINSCKHELPYEEDNFELMSTKLSEKGEVLMIAKIKIEGSRRKYDTYKAVLMHLDMSVDKAELSEVDLPFEKRIATSMSFFLSKNNDITVLGMYANTKDAEFAEGVFKIVLEKSSLKVLSSSYQKFMKGMQSRNLNGSKFDQGVCFDYMLKHYFVNSNDEKFMVFENRVERMISSSSSTSKLVTTTDLVVVKMNKDDQIVWNSLIFKNQVLSVPYSQTMSMGIVGITISVYRMHKKYEDLLSYACLFKNDNLYFVFNDHTNNMKAKFADKPFNSFKKSYSALVTLNAATGKWEKKMIFNNKEEEMLITPQNSSQISDDKILTFSFKDDRQSGIGYIKVD